ncbi:MAG: GNAT family N-acetyltransferase [Caldilineaceae bacterium]|nr:GNAT family N-acetyltransferase [Caldilineaceae bacterium]
MVDIRTVEKTALAGVTAIDVSERGDQRYRLVAGQLQLVEQAWERSFWDAEAWPRRLESWAQKLKPDCYLGAYDGEQMVGIAGLRYRLTPTMAQLTSLYIDVHYRRQGVAHLLVQEVFRLSKESGAEAIYVSSKPSVPAVGFYTRQGFRPTAEPDPVLFGYQPEDIHMVRPLS